MNPPAIRISTPASTLSAAASSPGPTERATVYGLQRQSRTLVSVAGNQDRIQFLSGTCDPRGGNELHLLDFDDEAHSVRSTVIRHPEEVWAIAPCPSRAGLLFTVHSSAAETAVEVGATLWALDDSTGETVSKNPELKVLGKLGAHEGPVKEYVCYLCFVCICV